MGAEINSIVVLNYAQVIERRKSEHKICRVLSRTDKGQPFAYIILETEIDAERALTTYQKYKDNDVDVILIPREGSKEEEGDETLVSLVAMFYRDYYGV